MQKRYLPVLLTLQAYEMNVYNLCYHNIKVIITTAHDHHIQVTYHFLKVLLTQELMPEIVQLISCKL